MYDEDTGAEPKIVSASVADPFILLLRDDSSLFVAQCDDKNDLEEIEREDDTLLATKWLSGCLYTDSTGFFAAIGFEKPRKATKKVFMFLLSAGGALHVSRVQDATISEANERRSMHFLTCQGLSTLQRVSVLCRPFFQPTMLPGDRQLVRISQKFLLLISATQSPNFLTSLHVHSPGRMCQC
jgi:hypothetical protein